MVWRGPGHIAILAVQSTWSIIHTTWLVPSKKVGTPEWPFHEVSRLGLIMGGSPQLVGNIDLKQGEMQGQKALKQLPAPACYALIQQQSAPKILILFAGVPVITSGPILVQQEVSSQNLCCCTQEVVISHVLVNRLDSKRIMQGSADPPCKLHCKRPGHRAFP